MPNPLPPPPSLTKMSDQELAMRYRHALRQYERSVAARPAPMRQTQSSQLREQRDTLAGRAKGLLHAGWAVPMTAFGAVAASIRFPGTAITEHLADSATNGAGVGPLTAVTATTLAASAAVGARAVAVHQEVRNADREHRRRSGIGLETTVLNEVLERDFDSSPDLRPLHLMAREIARRNDFELQETVEGKPSLTSMQELAMKAARVASHKAPTERSVFSHAPAMPTVPTVRAAQPALGFGH